MTLKKETALYLKGVVIGNNIPDTQGDILNKTDIKKIYTNFINPKTDIMHTYIENSNVYILSNYISETEETINNQTVPVGSWISEIMVINEEIKQMISDQKLNGFSLGSIPKQNTNENYFKNKLDFLNKPMHYRDLNDAEDINPLFISLVDKPANTFLWDVYDYNAFINKNKTIGGYNLAKEQINILNKVLDFINKSDEKKEDENPKEINKQAPVDETKPTDKPSENPSKLEEKIDAFIEDQNKKMDALIVAMGKIIDEISPKEDKTEKSAEEPIDTKEATSEDEEGKSDGKINKRTTQKLDGLTRDMQKISNFNERTGRTINGFKK